MTKAIIRKDAMVAVAVAGIEVFKKESYGLLLGEKKGKEIIVRDALGFQSAMRDYYSSSVFDFRSKRVNDTLKYLAASRLIGDFHSHTNGVDSLSKADKEYLMNASPGHLSLLISISKTKKNIPWKYKIKKRCLCGSIAKKYYLKIHGFVCDEKEKRIKKVQLSFPRKKEINERMRHFSLLEK